MRFGLRTLATACLTPLLLAACSDSDTVAADPAATQTQSASPTPAVTASTEAAPRSGCRWTPGAAPAKPVEQPQVGATAQAKKATIKTNRGTIGFSLDPVGAPCTVLNLETLAAQGYFDSTVCHRLTTLATGGIAVLQCGDPSGLGTGGPGWTIPDELKSAEALDDSAVSPGAKNYAAGTVAMANTGAPDSGGSQFFLVYEDSPLSPKFTVFGHLDEASLELVREIGAEGLAADQTAPKNPVEVSSLTTS